VVCPRRPDTPNGILAASLAAEAEAGGDPSRLNQHCLRDKVSSIVLETMAYHSEVPKLRACAILAGGGVKGAALIGALKAASRM
jgi:hypothetical protein